MGKMTIHTLCQKCGGENHYVEQLGEGEMYTVICSECGHSGPPRKTRPEALIAWASENRAAERKLIARIGEFEMALVGEKNACQRLRANMQAARNILADIDAGVSADRAQIVRAAGQAFQVLDSALVAEACLLDRKEVPKC